MAKKEKNSGLGRGLDSLIPVIEEKEVEEGISLEDLLKRTEEAKDTDEIEDIDIENGKDEFDVEPVDEDKELLFTEEDFNDEEDIVIDESDVEEYEKEIIEEEMEEEDDEYEENIEDAKDSSTYTNVFSNDDEKPIEEEKKDKKSIQEKTIKNIKSPIDLKKENNENTKIINVIDEIVEVESLLSEKEEKLVGEVIETVEKNPRITLWSARSAAVLRFLRKTEPEFSISNEASSLIDDAIAEKYPEIWTLFNHL